MSGMIYWDTSAWVRRYTPDHPSQPRAQNLFERSRRQFASELLPLEALSAAVRNPSARRGGLAPVIRAIQAELEVIELASASESLKEAERLVLRHKLRAADAIGLGGAILLRRRFARMPFVSCDEAQAQAARAEGLRVIQP
jgi:predicted nucleic acid-binding protein